MAIAQGFLEANIELREVWCSGIKAVVTYIDNGASKTDVLIYSRIANYDDLLQAVKDYIEFDRVSNDEPESETP